MTILESEPYILTKKDGSIIIGITREDNQEIKAGDECSINLNNRHLIGYINKDIIFDFDLSKNEELEELVLFAFYSTSNPMINVWEANDNGMIPWNNIIYLNKNKKE